MSKPKIKILFGSWNRIIFVHTAENGFRRKAVMRRYVREDDENIVLCNFYIRVMNSIK